MKIERLLLFLSMTLASIQCTHPFQEDMIGSHPFFDTAGKDRFEVDYMETGAKKIHLEIPLKTNISLSVSVKYEGNTGKDWISHLDIDRSEDGFTLSMDIDENRTRQRRSAVVTVFPGNVSSGTSFKREFRISQKAFDIEVSGQIYKGDLILRTQEDISNNIYVGVEGRLIIGNKSQGYYESNAFTDLEFVDSDITDLEGLSCIRSVSQGIVIGPVASYCSFSPLTGIDTPLVEFIGSKELGFDSGFRMEKVEQLYLTAIRADHLESYLSAFPAITRLEINDSEFTTCGGFSGTPLLRSVSVHGSGDFKTGNLFSSCHSLETADFGGNSMTSLEGLRSAMPLKKLFVGNNRLRRLGGLYEMNRLQQLDISNNGISRFTVNYLKLALPTTGIIDTGGNRSDGDMRLAMQLQNSSYSTAQVRYDKTGQSDRFGYVLSENGKLDMKGFTAITDGDSGELLIRDLKTSTAYTLWLYAEAGGEKYLSDPLKFQTADYVERTYTFTPLFPQFANSSSYGYCSYITSYRYANYSTGPEIQQLTAEINGGNVMMKVQEGDFEHLFLLFENTQNNLNFGAENADDGSLVNWVFTQLGTSGQTGDFILAAGNVNLDRDITEEKAFVRPLAELALSVEIVNANYRQTVSSVDVAIMDCTNEFRIHDNILSFTGLVTNVFSAEVDPSAAVQTVRARTYVLPNPEGSAGTVQITLHMKDGTTQTAQMPLGKPLEANNHYDLNVVLGKNQQNNSFTIEDIVIVEDEIEF